MARLALRPDLSLALVCLGLYVATAAQVRLGSGTALAVAYQAFAQPVAQAVGHLTALAQDLAVGRQDWQKTLAQLQQLKEENQRLARENQILASELLILRQAHGLLGSFPSFQRQAILAAVVSRDLLGTHTLVVNRGRRHGVERDSAVVATEGVLGRVDLVWEEAARVQLLSHPAAAAAARVVGVEGEALLLGGERPRLEGLPPYTEVPVKSPVVTTGSEGIYPPGLPLGITGKSEVGAMFTVVPVTLVARPEDAVAVLLLPRGGVAP
ncbi:MAG: rod shape-determining protein MreC [Thermoanaerobaculum sp.]|nr:rod shape-determining protein MreC [Thermoanaerobaculum sp.]